MAMFLQVLLIVAIVLAALVVLLFLVYWFNLDMKLIRFISPAMKRHYDNLPRDRRL